jgi:hypothetical protein
MADDIKQEFYALEGGLDTQTPAMTLSPGKCFDAQNYEPVIDGGYARVDGFERFDGHAAPSAASYWILGINKTGTIAVSDTLTGASSGATSKVLAISGSSIIIGALVGAYTLAESLTDGGTVGTVTTVASINSAPSPSDDADYTNLAAASQRLNILKVPGSGKIRGVWCYKDVWYAFRDNAGATAGAMYKSTAGGWSLIPFGTEIQFTGAVGQVNIGDTITGGTSGATATVTVAMLRTGTWTVAGAGTLIIAPIAGVFASGESLKVAAVTKVTSSSLATAITRAVGGSMEFSNYNFTGSTLTQKMYGVDGVNLAFEFDGTTYVPIRTGMNADTPTHVYGHKNYLFMSFLGSVQFSALGAPYSWTVVLGAGEIAVGDTVSGFLPQGGSFATGSTLAIFTNAHTHILYGSSSADFKLVTSVFDIGYSPFTMQNVSNNAYGMTARGIQSLITTLTFGDFDYASISHEIQSFINTHKGLEISSCALKAKNQYRVFYSDNYALAVGLTGDKVSAIMPLNYGIPVRCICTATLTTGLEVTMFGSDDGYIYQDSIGTSFDGSAIEAWIRLPFNHSKSPRTRKRYRRCILEGKITSYAQINVSYDIGYGDPNVQPSAPAADTVLTGGGGYWDQFTWDQFTWDAQIIGTPTISLEGTDKNISFLFYSNRTQDHSHVIQGITLIYQPRRLER